MNKNQHRQTGNQNQYHQTCVCQALVLTHEEATDIEKFPYLAVMLRPLQVLEFYGRCATRDPVCLKSEAVFHWWKDSPKLGNFAKQNQHHQTKNKNQQHQTGNKNQHHQTKIMILWIVLFLRTWGSHT